VLSLDELARKVPPFQRFLWKIRYYEYSQAKGTTIIRYACGFFLFGLTDTNTSVLRRSGCQAGRHPGCTQAARRGPPRPAATTVREGGRRRRRRREPCCRPPRLHELLPPPTQPTSAAALPSQGEPDPATQAPDLAVWAAQAGAMAAVEEGGKGPSPSAPRLGQDASGAGSADPAERTPDPHTPDREPAGSRCPMQSQLGSTSSL
jgi:hypothetical protein